MGDYLASTSAPLHVLLNPLAWVLWLLDFLCWLLSIIGPSRTIRGLLRGAYSKAESQAQRVNVMCPASGPISRIPGEEEVTTVHELMQRSFTKFRDVNAFGTRAYLGEHKPEGQRFALKARAGRLCCAVRAAAAEEEERISLSPPFLAV